MRCIAMAMVFALLLAERACGADAGTPPTGALSPLLDPPAGNDYTAASLRGYQQRLYGRYGAMRSYATSAAHRDVPLDVKADYFTWELWRYHMTSFDQVYHRALLSDQFGKRPEIFPDRDDSTWSGSYLAALSYEYAVKRDRQTLERICRFLRGMHFFFEVTGQPGLPARCVNRADGIVDEPMRAHPYRAADGTLYYYEADPAKGGYNQIAGGYAALMMLVYADLPEDSKRLARRDIADLVLHVIDHDYHATDRDGVPTTYGNMTPLVGTMGVPFNAQVAYEIVALGYSFPPDDPAERERIIEQFRRLRGKHHAYYEDPWALVQPQRVGITPFVKGMNDRNHVNNAAFTGLALELDFARRHSQPPDKKFIYQLGQTMYLGLQHSDMERHSLCNFMWAAITGDPAVFETIVTHRRDKAQQAIEKGLADGVEQLRRFKLDRWHRDGQLLEDRNLHWIDEWRPDDCYWKEGPRSYFVPTAPETNICFCAADYLYAYWLMRYYKLDQHPSLARQNLPVLRPTPGL